MAGLFSAISLTADIVKAVSSSDDTNKAILDLIKNQGKARIVRSDGSMTRFLSSFIVEPVIIVSKEAYKAEPIENLIGLNTDLFSSFYLQAFNVLGNIHGVDIATAIAVMSSDTSSFKSAAIIKGAETILSNEAKDYFRDLESGSRYLTFSHEAAKSEFETFNSLRDLLIGSMPGSTEEYIKDTMQELLGCLYSCSEQQLDELAEGLRKLSPSDAGFVDDLVYYAKQSRDEMIKAGIIQPDVSLPDDAFNAIKYSASALFSGKNAMNGKSTSPGKGPKDHKQAIAKAATQAPIDKNNKAYIKWKMTQESQITAVFKNSKIADKVAENLYAVHTRELNITLNITNSQIGTQVGGADNGKKIRNDFATKTIVIPITIKANIIVTDMSNIINMLKPNDRTKKFGYRLDEWRSGSISLRELIFCGDLIKAYKGNKLSDKDGLLSIIKRREESANSKLITAGVIGFEKFYNMVIVSADEKVLLNKHVGGNIDNERYKDELLTEAHALTLTIVDPDYERCYIVTKDIRGKSEISFKALKKKKDNDLNDIYKALVANRSPVF